MIPKKIHQTWKTRTVPARFREAAASWKNRHPDWEYCLWTDADLLVFVEKQFPDLLDLYCAYPDHIQRVDAARYMLLFHYGGLYADLDIVCNRAMDKFLEKEVLLAPTRPAGLSNDLMMAKPGHPFFKACIDGLEGSFNRFNHFFILRHFRVMLTTGPLFVTGVHSRFPDKDRVFLLPSPYYDSQNRDLAHVIHIPGDTWAGWDTHMLNFIANHWKPIAGTSLLLLVVFLFMVS